MMQATLWKCLLSGSVEILVCDWSFFRHGCLEPKNSKRNCNCYIREKSNTILIYDIYFLNDIKTNAKLNEGC